ncbi:hypothetical protein ACHAWF_002631, partial [Thalassiosira exigua]
CLLAAEGAPSSSWTSSHSPSWSWLSAAAASRSPLRLRRRAPPPPSSFASPPLAPRAKLASRRGTKSMTAAVVTAGGSSDGGGGRSPPPPPAAALRPNWRVVDVLADGERGPGPGTPFCHRRPPALPPPPGADASASSPPGASSSSAAAAPWSERSLAEALDLYERLRSCDDPYLAPAVASALRDLDMAYRLYGPYCVVGSYNGGKDAVVIFHLMRAAHAHYCDEMRREAEGEGGEGGGGDVGMLTPRPRVIYFQHRDEFPEILSLLEDTVASYDADMLAFEEGTSFGDGLKFLVERNFCPGKDGASRSSGGTVEGSSERPSLPPPHPLAFVLGTRKDDPNAGSQGVYAPSSHYMPPFLRVNPILDWTYGQVWHFLRSFDLPYCSLYDDGYTSLGTVKDTLPCPALRKGDGGHWPAYMLRDWDMERAGRIDKKKKAKGDGAESKTSAKEGGTTKGDPSGAVDATMSQTSSTISMPASDSSGGKLPSTMSRILNVDDSDAASNLAETSPEATSAPFPSRPSVGLVVIGDELLKGMTPDSNIVAAAKALRANGVSLARVSIIPDDGREIVDEVRRFREEVDVVITSGGVGPTHDDVTIKSVAEALDLDLELHCEMAELLIEKMGSKDNAGGVESVDGKEVDRRTSLVRQMSKGQRKMSWLPRSSVLQYLTDDSEEWPVLRCQNIFILPGVPTYFEKNINQLAAHLPTASSTFPPSGGAQEDDVGLSVDDPQTEKERSQVTPPPRSDTFRVVLSLDEDAIVAALNASVAAHPHVSFGSYPIVDDPQCKT